MLDDGLDGNTPDDVRQFIVGFYRGKLVLYSRYTSPAQWHYVHLPILMGFYFRKTHHEFCRVTPNPWLGYGLDGVSEVHTVPLPQCTLPKTLDNHYLSLSLSTFLLSHPHLSSPTLFLSLSPPPLLLPLSSLSLFLF